MMDILESVYGTALFLIKNRIVSTRAKWHNKKKNTENPKCTYTLL